MLNKFITQIEDPDQTLSAILLNKILSERIDFLGLGRSIGTDNKNHYINQKISQNPDWTLLEKESADSKQRQVELERGSKESFEDFVTEYCQESSYKNKN